MTFTYSLTDSTGLLRLEIGDTVEESGVRPGGRNFSDEELAIFLAEGSVGRASARTCEVLANEWSAQAGTQRLGPMSEARNQAERYEARAKHLRLAYGHSSDNTQAAGFTSQIFVRSA